MSMKPQAGNPTIDKRFADELNYLYQRLSTVNNLIRTLEEYDQVRPKPAQMDFPMQEKTA